MQTQKVFGFALLLALGCSAGVEGEDYRLGLDDAAGMDGEPVEVAGSGGAPVATAGTGGQATAGSGSAGKATAGAPATAGSGSGGEATAGSAGELATAGTGGTAGETAGSGGSAGEAGSGATGGQATAGTGSGGEATAGAPATAGSGGAAPTGLACSDFEGGVWVTYIVLPGECLVAGSGTWQSTDVCVERSPDDGVCDSRCSNSMKVEVELDEEPVTIAVLIKAPLDQGLVMRAHEDSGVCVYFR